MEENLDPIIEAPQTPRDQLAEARRREAELNERCNGTGIRVADTLNEGL